MKCHHVVGYCLRGEQCAAAGRCCSWLAPKEPPSTELDQIGRALYGPHYKGQLARELGVKKREMQRWCGGRGQVPENILGAARWLAAERATVLRQLLNSTGERET